MNSTVDLPIDEVAASVHTIATDGDEADGTMQWSATTAIVVKVSAGPFTGVGWTYTDGAAATLINDTLGPSLTTFRAHQTTVIHEHLRRLTRNLGRPGLASMAISAIDIAVWDLKAQSLGVPLWQLFGAADPSVPFYGSGGFTTYSNERTARQIRHWITDLGANAVKIKIAGNWGSNVERDLERIRLVRQVAGPAVELFVDANGGYSTAQAIRVARRCESDEVTWFEEPVSSDDPAGLAAVRSQVSCDVAAGEYVFDPVQARTMCAAGAVDCLQLDLTRCGGFTGWLKCAAVADSFGIPVSAHCAPALHAQLGGLPGLQHVEYFHDHARVESMLFDGIPSPAGGQITANTEVPGTGITLKAEVPGTR